MLQDSRTVRNGEGLLVEERRAAVLMGLTQADLAALATQAAVGQARNGSKVFTYDELQRLSLMAARPRD